MMSKIKRVPVPLSAVMLGFASLGNLLYSYGEGLRYVCGSVAVVLLCLLLLKLVCFPKMIIEDLKNPIMASVAATFPMSLMLLSTYIKPASRCLWFFAIVLHVVCMIYFTFHFLVKREIKQFFASYFIVYVGIVVASVTAPAFDQRKLGDLIFWFGLATLVLTFVLVTWRYVKYAVADPAKPLICIYAAPTSLCLAGYIQSAASPSIAMVITLFVISTILCLFALFKCVSYLHLAFYPSYGAYTFPFVISAIASKQTITFLIVQGRSLTLLPYLVGFETIIAIVMMTVCFWALLNLSLSIDKHIKISP